MLDSKIDKVKKPNKKDKDNKKPTPQLKKSKEKQNTPL